MRPFNVRPCGVTPSHCLPACQRIHPYTHTCHALCGLAIHAHERVCHGHIGCVLPGQRARQLCLALAHRSGSRGGGRAGCLCGCLQGGSARGRDAGSDLINIGVKAEEEQKGVKRGCDAGSGPSMNVGARTEEAVMLAVAYQ
eukprot:1138791-Pelagomonas_calceolata.AAC.4